MATVAGLFDNSTNAHRAVEELAAEGWPRDNISIVARQQADTESSHTNLALKDAEKGAVVGGLAGLFLGLSELAVPGVGLILVGGWLAVALLGAGVGAAAGGLVGSLVEAGISHEAAGHLAEGVRRGEILVTVKTDADRADAAAAIMQRCHPTKIESRTA